MKTQVLRITSTVAGFRRAGLKHPTHAVDHLVADLTPKQVVQLMDEPKLIVQWVEIERGVPTVEDQAAAAEHIDRARRLDEDAHHELFEAARAAGKVVIERRPASAEAPLVVHGASTIQEFAPPPASGRPRYDPTVLARQADTAHADAYERAGEQAAATTDAETAREASELSAHGERLGVEHVSVHQDGAGEASVSRSVQPLAETVTMDTVEAADLGFTEPVTEAQTEAHPSAHRARRHK